MPTPGHSWLLQKPVTPENLLITDSGAVIYWSHCMACHGDKGQGLTDEWRSAGFGADMDCWTSQCHASEQAALKYKFPRQVPPLVGTNALLRYVTTRDLNQHIQTAMPWWDPDSLARKDAWALTAYLLRENGRLPRNVEFDSLQAALAPVHLPIRPQTGEQTGQYVLAGLLVLTAAALITVNRITAKNAIVAQGARRRAFQLFPPPAPAQHPHAAGTLALYPRCRRVAVFLTLIIGVTGPYSPLPGWA